MTVKVKREDKQKNAYVNSQGQTVVSAREVLDDPSVKDVMKDLSPKVNKWIKAAASVGQNTGD